jgi:transcriptional regulator with XRE-family HTH domain
LITSDQIRAARALLKWSGKDLAGKSGVGFSTIMKMESELGVPNSNFKTFEAIRKAFEGAGVEFIGGPYSQAGVRWKKEKLSLSLQLEMVCSLILKVQRCVQ